jgi:L-lactate permease
LRRWSSSFHSAGAPRKWGRRAAIVALIVFSTPWQILALAGRKGVWDAVLILHVAIQYVVWPALLLYQATKQAGTYDALRPGIATFGNRDLRLTLLASNLAQEQEAKLRKIFGAA